MFQEAERPRVAVLKVGLAALAVVFVVATGGAVVGKASVDKRSTSLELKRAAASGATATRELAGVKSRLGADLAELERSKTRWRARARRAEALTERWRQRAHRAERMRGPAESTHTLR